MTSTLKIALAAGAVAVVLVLSVFFLQELKGSADSPVHIRLVSGPGGGAAVVIPDASLDPSSGQAPAPAQAQTGAAVGFAFYSTTPRAQTADISVLAHHTVVPVTWSETDDFDTQFLWPPVPTGWTNSDPSCGQPCGYRGFAFPGVPGVPQRHTVGGQVADIGVAYETQHDVSVNGVAYDVVISKAWHDLERTAETLHWDALP